MIEGPRWILSGQSKILLTQKLQSTVRCTAYQPRLRKADKSLGILRLLEQRSRPAGRLQIRKTGRRARDNTMIIKASIFGVGAPEALLVGVVALVIFGPKGLAQAVKSLGATLRTFSPTIKELASVTNELSSTLQEQIGLDEIRNEFRNPAPTYRPSSEEDELTVSSSDQEPESKADLGSTSQSLKEVSGEDLQAKIEESKRLAWGKQLPEDQSKEPESASGGQNVSASIADVSVEELEAELRRRREKSQSTL